MQQHFAQLSHEQEVFATPTPLLAAAVAACACLQHLRSHSAARSSHTLGTFDRGPCIAVSPPWWCCCATNRPAGLGNSCHACAQPALLRLTGQQQHSRGRRPRGRHHACHAHALGAFRTSLSSHHSNHRATSRRSARGAHLQHAEPGVAGARPRVRARAGRRARKGRTPYPCTYLNGFQMITDSSSAGKSYYR